jgi:hypothetical protein
MTVEETLIILFGLIIIIQCFFMYIMSRRIQQLLDERDKAGFAIDFSENELEEISRTAEEFKRHQI